MPLPSVNILAVLVSGAAIFALGGLWYSPALFSRKWVALMGKTEKQMRAAASSSPTGIMFIGAFVCGLLVAWTLAAVINHFGSPTAAGGAEVGALCWLFAGTTSFATSLFSMQPRGLWLINSGYNLVSFVIGGGDPGSVEIDTSRPD